MYLLGTLLWLAASGFIAWHGSRMFLGWTRWKGNVLLRSGLAVLLLPVTFIAPLADEIVGKYQFDRLCEEAKEVKIYGMIPVGDELYTPEGKWRSSETGDNDFHLQQLRESLVLWDTGGPFPKEIAAYIPIRMHHTKLYERKNKRLLNIAS